MQLFRGSAKSLSLQEREQISKMAKLGPIVHSSLLDIERALNTMLGAESLLIRTPSYGNPDSKNMSEQQKLCSWPNLLPFIA